MNDRSVEPTTVTRAARPLERVRFGLQLKVAALIVVPALVVATAMSVTVAQQVYGVMGNQARERGLALAQECAINLAAPLSSNRDGIHVAAQRMRQQIADVAYVIVRDANSQILAMVVDGDLAHVRAQDLPRDEGDRATAGEEVLLDQIPVLPLTVPIFGESGHADSDTRPEAHKRVGTLQMGLRLDGPKRSIARAVATAAAIASSVLVVALLAAIFLARTLVRRVVRLAGAATAMAQGNLGVAVDPPMADELGELAAAFGTLATSSRTMVADLRMAASEVEREAMSILATSTQQSAMANQQASAINETSTTVTEIAQTSKQATEHADSVIKIAQRSEDLSREGQRVVEEAMAGMEKLAEQVKAIALSITDLRERTLQIGDIITTVKDLAEQSNLLALNASIEATKAGEHGRGFTVVAMEMRNLAEQSKLAAGEVRAILSEIQKGTRVAVAATEEGSKRAHAAIALAQGAGSSIMGLADVIRDSSSAARQIASNTRQQTIGVEQIVSAITELSSAMSDALEGTRRIEAVAGNLTTVSKRLSQIVGRYQV